MCIFELYIIIQILINLRETIFMNISINLLCHSILILLYTPILSSMKWNNSPTSSPVIHEQKNYLNLIERGFGDGINQYNQGNEKLSKAILTGSYCYGKKHNLLDFIEPNQFQTARSILYKINHSEGFFKTAEEYISEEYAMDNVQKAILYRHKAQQAHTEQKYDIEKEYYTKAFDLFKESHTTNRQAKKHYLDALWCGRGCTYDPRSIQNYYVDQLEKASSMRTGYLDQHTYLLSNKIIKQSLVKLSQLANENPGTQCRLAKIYYEGAEGIVPSHEKSLELCENAIYSLAVLPVGQSLEEYDGLDDIINKLCNNNLPTIQAKAHILKQYFTLLTAIKKNNAAELQKLAKFYQKDTTFESFPFQLLCSGVNPSIAEYIHNSTISDPKCIHFYNSSEGELAAHILEWALLDVSYEPHIQDLFHIILGSYEYNRHKYTSSYKHFQQCSHYATDIYLQALAISMDDNPESRKEKIASTLTLLINTFNQTNNKRINAAQKIIVEASGYDTSVSIEHTLSACKQWIPLLAVSNNNEYPLEYVHVFMGLSNLRKNMNMLSADQSTIATKLITYFEFFSLLKEGDTKKLDAFFSKKNNELSGIRRTVLQALKGNKKASLQKIIFENKAFSEFCSSDQELINIIAHIAHNPQSRFHVTPADCNYFMGGYESINRNYDSALSHFLKCDINNPYIMAKILEANPIKNLIPLLKQYIPLINNATENNKTIISKEIIGNIIAAQSEGYVGILLEEENYQEAYIFTDCLMQLNTFISFNLISKIFRTIECAIMKTPFEVYDNLLEIPARLATCNSIKAIANEKNISACDCIAFLLHEHSKYPSIHSFMKTILQRECLSYLSTSLKNESRTTENIEIKKKLCSELACAFGAYEKSIPLLDEAIKYGSARALYEKATILNKQRKLTHKDFLPEVIDLLEKHIISSDNDFYRGKSYKSLGKYYYSIKDQKKSFDCLKAAADLGNYEAGHLLALLYFEGFKTEENLENKEGFLCLQKTIAEQKKNYYDALFIRSIFYYRKNKYTEAFEDLKTVLESNIHTDSQKIPAYWLMGILQLKINNTLEISSGAMSCLTKAYNESIAHTDSHLDSSGITETIFSNDEKTLIIIIKYINDILNNKKTNNESLDFCYVMGAVLFKQCINKPLLDELRKLSVECLVYAAQNLHVDATLCLLYTHEQEVSALDKVYYLASLMPHNPPLAETIKTTLAELYPSDVITQAILIKHFAKKNNPEVLRTYTCQMYEYEKPIAVDPVGYTLVSLDKIEQLIEDCCSLTSVLQTADAFIKNPTKSTPEQQFLAIWYGSLYMHSLNPTLLLQGMKYLETSLEYFPLVQKEQIEKNLGYIYYKLGWMESQKNNKASALAYLKKGVALKNEKCIQQVQGLIQTAVEKTVAQKKQPEQKKVPQTLNHLSIPQEQLKKYNVDNHAELVFLVHNQTDTVPTEERCSDAIETIIKGPEYIVKSENPMVFFGHTVTLYDKAQNNDLLKAYIERGFLYATIKTSANSHNLFKDTMILSCICDLITKIIKRNNTSQMNLLFKSIKQGLINYNIDIKSFERFYKSLYKINLAQNNIWKKIK